MVAGQPPQFYNDDTYWEKYAYAVNPQEVRAVVREHYIDFQGTPIHLDIYEQGIPPGAPTLIWCPGTAVYCRFYHEFLLRMWKRGYRVVCVDQVGHGKSGGARGHFTMPVLVEIMQATITYALQELKVTGKVVVGGSSLGGFTAFYTGEVDRARVAATICHNILYGGAFKANEMFRLRGLLKAGLRLLPILAKIAPKFRLSVWNYLKPGELIDPSSEKSKGLIDAVLADPTLSPQYSIAAIQSQLTWHPPTPLSDFKTPCFLLLGSQDAIFPLSMQQRLFDAVGAPKEIGLVNGGSHMVIIEQAEQCVAMIDRWLKLVLPNYH